MQRGVALVTGGSRGIGAAVARAAAAAGWGVCLTFHTDEDAAASVVAEIEAAGHAATAVRADVASERDVLAAFAAADEMGPFTALVANAGIVGGKARVDELTVERVERTLAVNVVGTIVCCREAVRRLSTRHGGSGGSIVLVSSAAPGSAARTTTSTTRRRRGQSTRSASASRARWRPRGSGSTSSAPASSRPISTRTAGNRTASSG